MGMMVMSSILSLDAVDYIVKSTEILLSHI